jgi:uncharacterized membrane protein YhhN
MSATRLLFWLGAAIALGHLANEWVKAPIPWGPAWKCAGIVLLGLYALTQGARATGIGLLLSAVGDVLLELQGTFVFGMAAFGLAHVCYIVAFAGWLRRGQITATQWMLAAAVLLGSIGLGVWFTPGMAELLAPGLIYQVIISTMVIMAVLSQAPGPAKIGAVVFMLSDSLIAVEKFAHVDVIPGAVWITYAVAQILIARFLTKPPVTTGNS